MKKIHYDTEKYTFKNIISEWFETSDLSKLHLIKDYEHFERENDQSTMWHKSFYKMIRKEKLFDDIYVKFLEDVIKPRFGEKIVYQKIPTFRVHLPGNIAVGEFHKDKYYRNVEWANKVKEINYFVPLTKAYDTNTIWVESEEDRGDFTPMECEYGGCIEWDASNLNHGNKDNSTNDTRVSFDFRVIPLSRYIDSNHVTINTKIPFGIGGYYEVL
jgi:hypothetical protein|tara:strand:+ start:220 stop:864 length:645 start_codon:yes stop_codon:yes gene_type:complete